MADYLIITGKAIFIWGFALFLVPLLIWFERKGAAFMQDRAGPNRAAVAGPFTPPGGFEDEAFATFELLGPLEIPALSRIGLVVLALVLAVAGVCLRR